MSITASPAPAVLAAISPTDTTRLDPVAIPLRTLCGSEDPALVAAKRRALSQAMHQGALDIQMQRE